MGIPGTSPHFRFAAAKVPAPTRRRALGIAGAGILAAGAGLASAPAASAGGPSEGPSPVDRRKTGSKRPLICDGKGMPLHVITTAANVNDIAQTLNLVDGISPVAGRPRRLRRRPECVLGDKA
ncbi:MULTISPECIES: transposase [Streptomyces]|uniref:transposase n=1 Tax=Streptomyces lycopersici TaxID=2974589 RepID=UPI0021D1FEA9|nr:transposase [Streptomyces sp. NEAU-383]